MCHALAALALSTLPVVAGEAPAAARTCFSSSTSTPRAGSANKAWRTPATTSAIGSAIRSHEARDRQGPIDRPVGHLKGRTDEAISLILMIRPFVSSKSKRPTTPISCPTSGATSSSGSTATRLGTSSSIQ